jgi:choline dehydrogenase-like flavoprotein
MEAFVLNNESYSHRYLSTEHDVNVLVRGLKLMFRLAATRPLSDTIDETFTDGRLDQDRHRLNDEQLTEIVKDRIETQYHPCCTARMAPLSEGGVVDPHLRVHGVSNLRVVDASVFPTIISGHTVSDERLPTSESMGLRLVERKSLYALTIAIFFIHSDWCRSRDRRTSC